MLCEFEVTIIIFFSLALSFKKKKGKKRKVKNSYLLGIKEVVIDLFGGLNLS